MTIKNVRVRIESENVRGNLAAHLNYIDTAARGLVAVKMAGRVTAKSNDAAFVGVMTGAGLRPSEAKRQKTLWERTADGVASPSVRDFRGPAKRLGVNFPEGGVFIAVHVLTEDATVCATSLPHFETVNVSQRANGEWRVSGNCQSYEDAQRLMLTAQALAAITEETGGYPTSYEVEDAINGYGVFRNYSVRRANLKPVSYTW